MPIYTVRAPDGKTIRLEGPAGASEADVFAQAQALYKPKAVAAPKPAKAPTITARAAKTGLDRGSQILEERIKNFPEKEKQRARDIYFQQTASLREKSAVPASQKKAAKTPSPRGQALRATMNMSPVLAPIAGLMDDDTLASTGAAVSRNLFGLPERAEALISGRDLKDVQAETDADIDRSLTGNILGTIIGGVAGGGGAGLAVRGLGKLASRGPGVVGKAGDLVQRAMTLEKGQKLKNAAKVVAAGGAGGAAQAAGEGKDVSEGGTIGAVGTGALVGTAKVAGYLARPVSDFLRMSDAGTFLRRFTKADPREIRANIENIRKTGAEPTLFEALPLEDRNRIGRQILARTSQTSERASQAIGRRTERMGGEMGRTSRASTGGARQRAVQAMQRDLEAAAGGRMPLDRGALPAGPRADASPSTMERFASTEAEARMSPFGDRELFENIDDILPTNPVNVLDVDGIPTGQINQEISDRPVFEMIRRKSKLVFGKDAENPSGGITGRNISALLSDLRDHAGRGDPDSDIAASAVRHIEDVLEEQHPDFLAANELKRAAFAGRMRTSEGMAEGSRTRTEAEITQPTRATDNAYQTPEGATGRLLGQANKLDREFSGTPNDVLRRAMSIAQDGQTQAALRANLGDDAAEALIAQARAQVEGARRLAPVAREIGQGASGEGDFDPSAVVSALLAVAPSTMLITKASALSRLLQLTHIPQQRANEIVDILFSGDPAITSRGVELLGKSGPLGRKFLSDLTGSIAIGGQLGQIASDGSDETSSAPSLIPEASAEEMPVEEDVPVEEETSDVPYGRAVIEDLFPEAYVTDDMRDPNSGLGRANPGSWHVRSDGAVDVRPIPGMTFEEFIATIEDEGYEILEAINEDESGGGKRSGHATGDHWHVVLA